MTFDELWGRHTPNSWARVPRGPAAVAVGSFLFGSTGILATTTIAGVSLATIGGFLVTTAITSWAMSALAPKPDMPNRNQLGNVKEPAGDFDIVYGEVRKGGVITFMQSSDRISGGRRYEDDYLHMIIVLAGHEVDSIGDIYLNDEVVNISSGGFVTGSRWKSLIRIKKYRGTATQTADPDLVAETNVTSAFRGQGIAYLYVRMDWDKDVFANGTPTITAMVRGRRVFDPRNNTTAWSDNAALCIRDYLTHPFGVNSIQSIETMQSPCWATQANVCDSVVTKRNGTTEKRYTLNGVVSTGNTPRDNLQRMLTSCGGTLFWGQGRWEFKAGHFPAGPYLSFDADDLRSGIDLVTKNSRKENFNAVTGIFLDKDQGFTEVEYPKVSSPVFLARDNGQDNILDVSLPYTVTASAAQRLAKMAMFRSREEIVISADFGLKAANAMVGDVIQFTFSRYGFNNKYFEVVTWKPISDDGELKFNLVLKETSAAAYDWNAEENDILKNNTRLRNPTAGLVVSNLAVTNRQTLQSDGTLLGEVTLSWDPATNAFIDKYLVQWKRATDTSWSSTETDETSIIIPSIRSGVSYTYRVKAVTSAGFTGAWESLTVTVAGKSNPPAVPTGLARQNLYRAVQLNWNNPPDTDLNHIEIYANTTNSTTGGSIVGKSGGTTFIYNMEPMQSRWFFVRAVDHSGNRSAWSSGVQGTALFIAQSEVDINVGQLLDEAGLSAVEVLATLPTTGNTEGRTVYNTTDKQLYVWNGTAWEKAVDADIAGKLLGPDNFPPSLRPVEYVNSLPTTGNFNGRVVMLSTDGKLYRRVSNAWTSVVPSSDITGQITETQIGPNAITTPKLAAGAVEADNLAANSVVAGKLAAGAVAADNLQANSVVSSKLLITNFSNLILNSDLADSDGWVLDTGVNRQNSPFAASTAQGNFRFPAGETTTRYARWGEFPSRISVIPGEQYIVGGSFRGSGSTPNFSVRMGMSFYDKDGVLVSSSFSTPAVLTDVAYTDVSRNFTIPSGVAFVRISLGRGGADPSTAGWGYLENPYCRRRNGGELIVDGAISTGKLAANSVTAGIIAAGAVNAAAIATNAVTADKINVNTLSAISADLGSITAGSININNQFIVNSSGTATIRSGTTGERLVIQNNRISVFDSSGTLRVRIGQL